VGFVGWELAFAVPFLWNGPLWPYCMKSGFATTTIFPEPDFFSAHAWTAASPLKINMWIELGA
jgi:hypothetical protein